MMGNSFSKPLVRGEWGLGAQRLQGLHLALCARSSAARGRGDLVELSGHLCSGDIVNKTLVGHDSVEEGLEDLATVLSLTFVSHFCLVFRVKLWCHSEVTKLGP